MSATKLQWQRTVIGDNVASHDFVAVVDGNITVARIRRDAQSAGKSVWTVAMQIGHRPFSGVVLTRREAIETVNRLYRDHVARHPGIDPQEWLHDAMSIQLRQTRERSPKDYAKLVEDLRSGRLDRYGRPVASANSEGRR